MTPVPVVLFINPTAGRGRAGARLGRIKALFAESGVAISVVASRTMGDLENEVMAHVRKGSRQVLVAGGDGSVHEAVNGILRADGDAALGLIPTGTGNDFAKACGITLDWEHATQLLAGRIAADAAPRTIDIGRMNDRFFANGAGIGFDAKVTRVARGYRWPMGDFVYLLAILRCLYDGVATPELTIRAGDYESTGPATLLSVCNGAWIGGMFHIAPMAQNHDGRLELLIAAPVSRRRILALLPKLMRGAHMDEVEISRRTVSSVTVRSATPVESHLDGEVQPLQDEFVFEILPGKLKLL